MASHSTSATFGGFAAVVLWSTMVATNRILIESLGLLTTGAVVLFPGGIIGCIWLFSHRAQRERFRRLSWRYLFGCGGLFVFYKVCILLALAWAPQRQDVAAVTVLNYLWPGLTLALSVPILHHRGGRWFPLGLLIAFGGIFLALWPPDQLTWQALKANLSANYISCILALTASITWALYSNLTKLWTNHEDSGATPLFLLVAAVVMTAARFCTNESSQWTPTVWPPLLFVAFVVILPACIMWERAMRRGNMTLVASGAQLAPLLAMGFVCVLLGIMPTPALWIACGLVTLGAIICKRSLRE